MQLPPSPLTRRVLLRPEQRKRRAWRRTFRRCAPRWTSFPQIRLGRWAHRVPLADSPAADGSPMQAPEAFPDSRAVTTAPLVTALVAINYGATVRPNLSKAPGRRPSTGGQEGPMPPPGQGSLSAARLKA